MINTGQKNKSFSQKNNTNAQTTYIYNKNLALQGLYFPISLAGTPSLLEGRLQTSPTQALQNAYAVHWVICWVDITIRTGRHDDLLPLHKLQVVVLGAV